MEKVVDFGNSMYSLIRKSNHLKELIDRLYNDFDKAFDLVYLKIDVRDKYSNITHLNKCFGYTWQDLDIDALLKEIDVIYNKYVPKYVELYLEYCKENNQHPTYFINNVITVDGFKDFYDNFVLVERQELDKSTKLIRSFNRTHEGACCHRFFVKEKSHSNLPSEEFEEAKEKENVYELQQGCETHNSLCNAIMNYFIQLYNSKIPFSNLFQQTILDSNKVNLNFAVNINEADVYLYLLEKNRLFKMWEGWEGGRKDYEYSNLLFVVLMNSLSTKI